MNMKILFALLMGLVGLATCGQSAPSMQQVQQTAEALAPTLQAGAQTMQQTAVALATQNPVDLDSVKQTAVALATQNPIDLNSVQQTAEVLMPTWQAQAPELQATAEALATLVPERGAPALATLQALTAGADVPSDIPIAQPSNMVLNTKSHIIYTSSQMPVELVQFYQTEMANQDWKLQPNSATTESGGRLGFEKSGRIVTITIVRTGDATTVDLALGGE